MIPFIIKLFFLFILILLFIIAGVSRTWQVEKSPSQKIFLAGNVPNPLPDGLYSGTVPGHQVSWLGKKFDSGAKTGINIFKEKDGTESEKYPFKTSVGTGIRDKNLSVFKIDYNISGNPFWLRPILDEVVEITPGHFLGKLQFRIFPHFAFTLGYFELEK